MMSTSWVMRREPRWHAQTAPVGTKAPMRQPTQRGLSLIGLLISATIGLITAVAIVQLYKNATQSVAHSSVSSKEDTHLSYALLSSSFLIQNAGFGIDKPQKDTDLQLLKSIAFDTQKNQFISASGSASSALLWRSAQSVPTGTATSPKRCEAIYLHTATSSAMEAGIYHLQTANNVDCSGALSSVTWSGQPRRLGLLNEDLGAAPAAQMQLYEASCSPFGQGPALSALVATLEVTNSAGIKLIEHYCLSNFARPS